MSDAEYPFPTERVKPAELREGDMVQHSPDWPWVTILKVHPFDEKTPDWERAAGTRGFICEHVQDDGRRRLLITYDGNDPDHTVLRRAQP